jgi:glycosyltransferase involved in cell wall biosynthesis
MRIAYIAPYQGPGLINSRPTVRNLALAGNLKIELVAELLHKSGHDIEILSQGEVVERRFKIYGGFREQNPSHPNIPAYYASALPVRFVNGLWSSQRTLALFKRRHRSAPFDLVIIYNLKLPQMICARYAMRRLGLPVLLEYEDDAVVDIAGKHEKGLASRYYFNFAKKILNTVSGGLGVSPHILSQFPSSVPKILLRGVVSDHVLKSSEQEGKERKDWVVYSGTLFRSKGLKQLITGWRKLALSGWELHIAGDGELRSALEKMAMGHKGIVFHGLLNRQDNAHLLSEAKIGINPHDVSQTPGNVFAFKIIEYLAAGTHVITTPMGALEPEIEAGITYMPDNCPETIAATLERVIGGRWYERKAVRAAQQTYGPTGVAKSLDSLLNQVVNKRAEKNKRNGASLLSDRRRGVTDCARQSQVLL